MKTQNFTLTLQTDKSPEEVFKAITNVRSWWSGYYDEHFTGNTEKLNDEFSFRTGDGVHHTKHKLVEVIPNKRVVWLVTFSELTFVEKKDEWVGTKVIFEINQKGDLTQLVFTHEGLNPEIECYNACAPAWTKYLTNKLLPMITSEKRKASVV